MKFLTGLITTLLVSLTGLVIVSPADAAPYPHTIKTRCHAQAKKHNVTPQDRPAFKFFITTQGNARPTATVAIKVIRTRDGAMILETHRFYNQPKETWTFHRLESGRYEFHFHAVTGPQSVYKNCSTAAKLKVRSR